MALWPSSWESFFVTVTSQKYVLKYKYPPLLIFGPQLNKMNYHMVQLQKILIDAKMIKQVQVMLDTIHQVGTKQIKR